MDSTLGKTAPAEPQSEMADDQQWIRETLNGNPEAYGKLVQKHHPLLFHMACRVL
jgi:DNA-directed RNA polymerase specialized sigma subunit